MSSHSTPESLDAEVEYLTRKIRETQERLHEDQKRLDEIETLLRLSRKYGLLTTGTQSGQTELTVHMERMGLVPEPRHPLRARIIASADLILSDGKRRLSRELLPELARYGVVVDGQNASANLSAYLSREKHLFQSSPSDGGWTLTRLARRGFQLNPEELMPDPDVAMSEVNEESR